MLIGEWRMVQNPFVKSCRGFVRRCALYHKAEGELRR
jgi:hypothetical protein